MSKKTESQKSPVHKKNNDLKIPEHLVRHFISEIIKKVEIILNISEPLNKEKRKTYVKHVSETIVNITLPEIPVEIPTDKNGSPLLTSEEAKKKTAQGITRQLHNGYKREELTLRVEDYKNRYFLLLNCNKISLDEFIEKYPLIESTNSEDLDEEESPIIDERVLRENLTYYAGFYYSIREFTVKKFGFAIDKAQIDNNGKMSIYEWGFHDKRDVKFSNFKNALFLQELGAKEDEPIDIPTGYSGINFDFETDYFYETKEVTFKGKGYFKDKLFFGNLTDEKTEIQMVCQFQNEHLMQGSIQAVTTDGKNPISVEVFLIEVGSKEDVFPLEITNIYKEIEGYDNDELKHIVMFLISKRNNYLIRPKTTLRTLGTGGTLMELLRDKLPGVYRVWNFDEENQVIQSRILIDEKYRCFLFPYFEGEVSVDLRVQCCTLNFNSTSMGKVWMPSFRGLRTSNIAIIDFHKHEKEIYKGVFGSVGKGENVIGDYMVLVKESRPFKVRKIGKIGEARAYAQKYGFPQFTEVLISFLKDRQGRFTNIDSKL